MCNSGRKACNEYNSWKIETDFFLYFRVKMIPALNDIETVNYFLNGYLFNET